jgi:hypothetical protein
VQRVKKVQVLTLHYCSVLGGAAESHGGPEVS